MKLVCNDCKIFMKPYRNGVRVIVHASFGPYQIFSADEYECTNCNRIVTTAFATAPLSEHYETNFQEALERARANGAVEVY